MIGGSRAHGQSAAAIFLRNETRQEPRLGQSIHELRWIAALAVERAPILTGKSGAKIANRFPDVLEGVSRLICLGR